MPVCSYATEYVTPHNGLEVVCLPLLLHPRMHDKMFRVASHWTIPNVAVRISNSNFRYIMLPWYCNNCIKNLCTSITSHPVHLLQEWNYPSPKSLGNGY